MQGSLFPCLNVEGTTFSWISFVKITCIRTSSVVITSNPLSLLTPLCVYHPSNGVPSFLEREEAIKRQMEDGKPLSLQRPEYRSQADVYGHPAAFN